MAHSDTDSDSDCFQSAEENVDSSTEHLNSASFNENNEVPKNKFYRKRPERAKRTPVKSFSNNSIKNQLSVLNDSIFKTNPDSIIQDFTSNITKNFNIGFNTFQQTSSSVKDILFNSIPTSPGDEKDSFTYDETNIVTNNSETFESVSVLEDEKECVPEKIEKLSINDSDESILKSKESESEIINEQCTVDEISVHSDEYCSVIMSDKCVVQESSLCSDEFASECSEDKSSLGSKEFVSHVFIEQCSSSEPSLNGKDCLPAKSEHFIVQEPSLDSKDSDSLLASEGTIEPYLESKESVQELSFSEESSSEKNQSKKSKSNEDQISSKKLENKKEVDSQAEKEPTFTKSENLNVNESDGVEVSNPNPVEDKNLEIKKSVTMESEINEVNKNTQENNFSTEAEKLLNNEIVAQLEPEALPSSKVQSSLDINDDNNENSNLKTRKNPGKKLENRKNSPDLNISVLKSALKDMLPKNDSVVKKENKVDSGLEESENKVDDSVVEESKNKVVGLECEEEKGAEKESSKDGWDDFEFDFNDSEFAENQDTGNSKEASAGLKEEMTVESKPESSLASTTKQSFISPGESSEESSKKLPVQPNNNDETDWGWDAWDDNEAHSQESNKQKSEVKSEEERWSGWDSFGVKKEKTKNWSLGSWGVDALLNKATNATTAISSVLEAGLGAPNPETLAKMDSEKQKSKEEPKPEESLSQLSAKKSLTDGNLIGGITNLFSEVTTKIVEHSKIQEIGSKVINTGLDTLEIVGKKTMEVLQEQDPGLKNKRALLMGDSKPVLSQVLREVKEKAEKEIKMAEEKDAIRKCHFETMFDDCQGLIHLEALEMLSTQCKLQLEQTKNGMSPSELDEWKLTLEEVEDLCCIDDLNELTQIVNFKISLNSAIEPLKDEIKQNKIIEIHDSISSWLDKSKEKNPSTTEVHQKAVQTIAQLTAAGVHQFHEAGKLLYIKECRKTVEEIDALSRMTEILCSEMKDLVTKFTELSSEATESASSSTNGELKEKLEVVLRSSVSYLKQAFELLVPIIQLGTKL